MEIGRVGQVIDLSLPLAEDLPCSWPGHMPYQRKVFNWFEDRTADPTPLSARLGPYHTGWLVMDEHTGTHVDAPVHAVRTLDTGGLKRRAPSIDEVSPSQLCGAARVIDASGVPAAGAAGHSPLIEPEHLREDDPETDIVLIRTGWDRHYVRGAAGDAYARDAKVRGSGVGWPAPSVELVRRLFEAGVRCVGTDAPSIAPVHDPGPVHEVGLGLGMVFVEGLANLAALPRTGFFFLCLPLKVVGGSGAPARAVALVPDSAHAESD